MTEEQAEVGADPAAPSEAQDRAIARIRREKQIARLQNVGLAIVALGVAVLVYIAATR